MARPPSRRVRSLLGAALAVLTALAAVGCGSTESSSGDDRTLVVFAAASLTESFTALGKTFESSHPGVSVKFNFAGSSALAQQIVQGAPADVFASANPATMATVADAKLAAGQPRVFVKNRLEIAVPPDNPGNVRTLQDLANPALKVVLCAEQVPCGGAATRALAAAGVKVRPVSEEKDVKAALTKVQLGEADAALVYRTDVEAAAGKVRGIEFPEAAKAVNEYPIVTLAEAPQPDLAGGFVRLVLSERGRTALTRAGFESP
ncbi:MAG: molybdate ABC transporter substrate-binding protein [Streptosporangiales bacterium]|nr:molybdate ABC transporter substrate-binding protein [Streptosporangiales bacterium]